MCRELKMAPKNVIVCHSLHRIYGNRKSVSALPKILFSGLCTAEMKVILYVNWFLYV